MDDIRSKPANDAYRTGWDRVFGERPKSEVCTGEYVDFQGARRPCLAGGEGCGLSGCVAKHGPLGSW